MRAGKRMGTRRSTAGAALWLAVVAALGTAVVVAAQGTCYVGADCSNLGTAEAKASYEECCLQNGTTPLSFKPDGGSGVCSECIVFGWWDAVDGDGSITLSPVRRELERSDFYQITAGVIKGNAMTFITGSVSVVLNISVAPATADLTDMKMSSNDFTLYLGQNDSATVVLRVDLLAMEPDEGFFLNIIMADSIVGGNDYIFINNIEIIIEDNDNVTLRFTEADYRSEENVPSGVIPVVVERTNEFGSASRLASDITIAVVPVSYTSINGSLYLPDDFPAMENFDPRAPTIAKIGIDFINDPLIAVFPRSNNNRDDLSTPVIIYDDDIDEVDEVFAVRLEVVHAQNMDRVNIISRNASLCRIVDNDNILISFKELWYTVKEGENPNQLVEIVKEGINETEITFTLAIQATSMGSGTSSAQQESDYVFNNSLPIQLVISPEEQSIYLFVRIVNDDQPEADESFQLVLSTVQNSQQFHTGRYSETTITILDDDPLDLGFVNVSYTVSEGIGSLTQEVEVIWPTSDQPLPLTIILIIKSVDDNAKGSEDFVELGFVPIIFFKDDRTDDRRLFGKDITIIDDDKFEEDETFFLTLVPHSSNSGNLIISRNVSEIVIEDNDYIRIGFNQTSYSTVEDTSIVVLTVKIYAGHVGSNIHLLLVVFDGTAVVPDDFLGHSGHPLTLTDDTDIHINVTITADSAYELTETFFANLSLVSPISDRIILDPSSVPISIVDDDEIIIGFRSVSETVRESDGYALINVDILSGLLSPGYTVDVVIALADGTATALEDYAVVPHSLTGTVVGVTPVSLTFTDGVTSHSILVSISAEDGVELTENFTAGLSFSTMLPLERITIDPSEAVVTILDDDELVIGFEAAVYSTSEGAAVVEIVVVILTGSVGQGETVILVFYTSDCAASDFSSPGSGGFSIFDDCATRGEDYLQKTETISFESGDDRVVISVTILDDDILEEKMELFSCHLILQFTELNVTVNPSSTDVVIEDDDVIVIEFSEDSYTGSESDDAIVFIVVVTIGGIDKDVVLNFSTSDNTAIAPVDYISHPSTAITFTSGQTSLSVSVEMMVDDLLETIETFIADLSESVVDVLLGARSSSTGVIIDDDSVTIGFQPVTYTVEEAAGEVTLTVLVLSGQLGRDVEIRLETSDISATGDIDFNSVMTNISFTPLINQVNVTIGIVDDSISEDLELFDAGLIAFVDRLTIDPDLATVYIVDNDSVTIGFVLESYSISEDAGSVSVVVRMYGELSRSVTVILTTIDNTAFSTVEVDFTATSQLLVFNAATSEHTVMIPIIDDDLLEHVESFSATLTLLASDDQVSLSPSEATITILDNDDVTIGFSDSSYTVAEGDGFAVVVVEVKNVNVLRRSVEVTLSLSNQTALPGEDYVDDTTNLVFDSGTASLSVSISILNDALHETAESFLASLTTMDSDVDLDPDDTVVHILDDDDVTFTFDQPMYIVTEGSGNATVCVNKNGDSAITLQIEITGDLQSGAIPDKVDTVLTFLLEEDIQCVTFGLVDDIIALELDELLTFVLEVVESMPGVGIGATATTTVMIIDDDVLTVTLVKSSVGDIVEGAGMAEACLEFSGSFAVEFPLIITATITNDTGPGAEPGSDFGQFRRTKTATLSDSDAGKFCFNISITDNDEVEDKRECFLLTVALGDDGLANQVTLSDPRQQCCILDDDVVTVGFFPAEYTVQEKTEVVFLTIKVLEGSLGRSATVIFTTNSGTATEDVDYVHMDAEDVVFGAGETVRMVRVTIINDNIQEDHELFEALLTTSDDAIVLNPAVAPITIIEDSDEVRIGFQPVEYEVSEDDGVVVLNVLLLSGTLDRVLVVLFQTDPESATSPADFISQTESLTFSSDVSLISVNVTVNSDQVLENLEIFTAQLVNITDNPVILDPAQANISILDDSTVTIGLQLPSYTVGEGNGTVEVCVELTDGELGRDVPVQLTTQDDSATSPDDYGSIDISLTLTAGSEVGATVCVDITINDDTVFEMDEEEFTVVVSPSGHPSIQTTPTTAVVAVIDNDDLVIGFNEITYTFEEVSGTATVCASVQNPVQLQSNIQLTINFNTIPGSAVAPSDYISQTGGLLFSSSNTQQCVDIPLVDDDVIEGVENEDFTVTLLPNPNPRVFLLPPDTTVFINDTSRVTISLEQSAYVVNEDAVTALVCAVIVNDVELARDVIVNLLTLDGTAHSEDDVDFSPTFLALTFTSGSSRDSTVCADISVTNDDVFEPDTEDFSVHLFTADFAVYIGLSLGTVSIMDDESLDIGFDQTSYNVSELQQGLTVCASVKDGQLLQDDVLVAVSFSTFSDTADSDDYEPSDGELGYTSNSTRHCVNITVFIDNLVEVTEHFRVVLLMSSSDRVNLVPPQTTVFITDDSRVEVGLQLPVYSVDEGGDFVTVCVEIERGELARDVDVHLDTVDETATRDLDFGPLSLTLSFTAGSSSGDSVCEDITIFDDNVFEPDIEDFTVSLSSGDSAVDITNVNSAVIILDNDVLIIGFESTAYTYSESAGTATVCAAILPPVLPQDNVMVIVTYETQESSAIADSDYIDRSGQLVFSSSDARRCVDISLVIDDVVEPVEQFLVSLLESLSSRVTLSPPLTTVSILETSRIEIGFTQPAHTVGEEESSVTLCVNITSGSTDVDIEIELIIEYGSVVYNADITLPDLIGNPAGSGNDGEGDFFPFGSGFDSGYNSSVILIFTAGSGPGDTVCLEITIINDTVLEPELETFEVNISTEDPSVDIDPDTSVVTIVDNDLVVIGFDQESYPVSEDDGTVTVCASIQNPVSVQDNVIVTVTFTTADGDAESGADYVDSDGTFVFTSTTEQQCTNISIIDDNKVEATEQFNVSLVNSSPDAVSLLPSQTSVLITDNDVLVIGFVEVEYTVGEDDGTVSLTVAVLSGQLQDEALVTFYTGDQTAIDASDYSNVTAVLTFSDVITELVVEVAIIDDVVYELDEYFYTFLLEGVELERDIVISPEQATVTITDDDEVDIRVESTQYSVEEDEGYVEVCVVMSGELADGVELEVILETASGSANEMEDYISVEQLLTLSSSVPRACVNITIVDDDRYEEDETFDVVVTTDEPRVNVDPDTASIDIFDDDEVEIGLESTQYSVEEDEGYVEVCVVMSGELADGVELEVILETASGSANALEDYDSVDQSLTLSSSVPRACVNITIVGDGRYEEDETFDVIVTTEEPRVTIVPDTASIDIFDDDEVTIGFDSTLYTVEEGNTTTVCLSVLSGEIASGVEIIVEYESVNINAMAPDDYISFIDGASFTVSTQLCFDVVTNDDIVYEGMEDFQIGSTTANPRVSLDPDTTTVQIIDNDAVAIGFEQVSYSVTEEQGVVEVCAAVLTGALAISLPAINFTTADFTATYVSDYVATSEVFVFDADTTRQCINITILLDGVIEPVEGFLGELSVPTVFPTTFVTIAPATTIIAITSSEVRIGFEESVYMTSEDVGSVEVCVSVEEGMVTGPITLTAYTEDDSAKLILDYTPETLEYSFDAGETRDCFTIMIVSDHLSELEETFSLSLVVSTGGSSVLLGTQAAQVVIAMDGVVLVEFAHAAYTFNESDAITVTQVTVIKAGAINGSFDVQVVGDPGIQLASVVISGSSLNEIITFDELTDSITVTITLVDDAVALETVEQYDISLVLVMNDSRVVLGTPNVATINILDDDLVGIGFNSSDLTVLESDQDVRVCVDKFDRTAQEFTADLDHTPGTAVPPVDYNGTSVPTTLTFAGNDISVCFRVSVEEDGIALEPPETFTLAITGTSHSDVDITLDTSVITILDSDEVTVSFASTGYEVEEDEGSVTVCVEKDSETVVDVSVSIFLVPFSIATPDADFDSASIPATVVIATDSSMECFSVQITNDLIPEGDESFTLSLTTPPGVLTGLSTTIITILGHNQTRTIQVNDTIVGDPLLYVPLYTYQLPQEPIQLRAPIGLCYEIHGNSGSYFNLVTDDCTSVNARWTSATSFLNVIDRIAIRAISNTPAPSGDSMQRICHNIQVDLDKCALSIDGVPAGAGTTVLGGIFVRKVTDTRVRISVPNCNEQSLVMWVICENNTIKTPVTEVDVTATMIKFVVTRGLNTGNAVAHGLIGQFYNREVAIELYNGTVDSDDDNTRYMVKIPARSAEEPGRTFTGIFGEYNWVHSPRHCIFAGNSQAGSIAEVDSPNDPVIAGGYHDYLVPDPFSEDGYEFGLFREDVCDSGLDMDESGSGFSEPEISDVDVDLP